MRYIYMIAYIEGKIDRLSPTNALLDVGGVGYDINITLTDYTALQGKPSARLWITEIIREDAHLLYGFVREESRAFFEKLCSVSGVGPSTARLILSSYTPNDLASIIGNGAVDLKGKIDLSAYDLSEGMPEGGNAPEVAAVSDEAQRALKMLGFPEAAIRKAVKAVLEADAHLPVEEVIKQALKRL